MKLRIYVDFENDELFEMRTANLWEALIRVLEELAKTEIPTEIQFNGKLKA